jgi:hypothetical protein
MALPGFALKPWDLREGIGGSTLKGFLYDCGCLVRPRNPFRVAKPKRRRLVSQGFKANPGLEFANTFGVVPDVLQDAMSNQSSYPNHDIRHAKVCRLLPPDYLPPAPYTQHPTPNTLHPTPALIPIAALQSDRAAPLSTRARGRK